MLQVIHKGKVLYPGKKGDVDDGLNDVSDQLLDLTQTDIIHRRKKPSLVITGLRQTRSVTAAVAAAENQGIMNFFIGLVRQLTPWYIFSLATWGFRWIFQTTTAVLRGIHLFFRSITNPPEQMQQ